MKPNNFDLFGSAAAGNRSTTAQLSASVSLNLNRSSLATFNCHGLHVRRWEFQRSVTEVHGAAVSSGHLARKTLRDHQVPALESRQHLVLIAVLGLANLTSFPNHPGKLLTSWCNPVSVRRPTFGLHHLGVNCLWLKSGSTSDLSAPLAVNPRLPIS